MFKGNIPQTIYSKLHLTQKLYTQGPKLFSQKRAGNDGGRGCSRGTKLSSLDML